MTSRLIAVGVVSGFLSALLGVGGGIVIVPLLVLVVGFELRPATATSLAAIGLAAAAGVVTYWILGDVRPGYAALVGLPAALGAGAGTSLQRRLPGNVLEYAFAVLLVCIAGWLLIS